MGPILAAILTLAAGQETIAKGTLLLAAYAIGLGLPFLLVAVFFERLTPVLNWLKRHLDRIEKISGLMLWTVGLMMLTGGFSDLSYWLLEAFPWLASVG